jgi:hypothetical protein
MPIRDGLPPLQAGQDHLELGYLLSASADNDPTRKIRRGRGPRDDHDARRSGLARRPELSGSARTGSCSSIWQGTRGRGGKTSPAGFGALHRRRQLLTKRGACGPGSGDGFIWG